MPREARVKISRRVEKDRATPQWMVFTVIAAMTCLLCLTVNFRAFSEMRQEMSQNETLNSQMEILTNENFVLQEEIHNLKSDSRAIEREARKIGMSRPNEKILVPTN